MKKLIVALAVAASLPAVSSAAAYQVSDSETFQTVSSSASFLLNWTDAVAYNSKKSLYDIADGKYSLLLTDALTNQVVFRSNNLNLNDTSTATSGVFAQTFSDLLANHSYILSFTGKWAGVSAGQNWSLTGTPSVSISPVPEPEAYAMFLAGLGIIGSIALRRKSV